MKEKKQANKPVKKKQKKTQKKWWRPSSLNFETVQKLVEIFRLDGTVQEACSQAEISTSTFYNYYNNDEEFLDNSWEKKSFKTTIDKARDFPFIVAKRTLVKYASQDPKVAIELLKRRHQDYKDKSESMVATFAFTWIEIGDVTPEDIEA